MTQGGTLATIAYGIIILPLIKNLKQEIPDATQPWYADDAVALDMFAKIETNFDLMTRQGLVWGYHPKLIKSVLIVRPENLQTVKVFGARHGFRVCTVACYLGGYIGDNESKQDWFRECTLKWEKNINTIRKTVGEYLQDSYAVVVSAIQSECIFLQCVTWDTGDSFAVVEKIIHETFLPRLFFGKKKILSPVVGALSRMAVNRTGLGILNPVASAQDKYLNSTQGSAELVRAVKGGGGVLQCRPYLDPK